VQSVRTRPGSHREGVEGRPLCFPSLQERLVRERGSIARVVAGVSELRLLRVRRKPDHEDSLRPQRCPGAGMALCSRTSSPSPSSAGRPGLIDTWREEDACRSGSTPSTGSCLLAWCSCASAVGRRMNFPWPIVLVATFPALHQRFILIGPAAAAAAGSGQGTVQYFAHWCVRHRAPADAGNPAYAFPVTGISISWSGLVLHLLVKHFMHPGRSHITWHAARFPDLMAPVFMASSSTTGILISPTTTCLPKAASIPVLPVEIARLCQEENGRGPTLGSTWTPGRTRSPHDHVPLLLGRDGFRGVVAIIFYARAPWRRCGPWRARRRSDPARRSESGRPHPDRNIIWILTFACFEGSSATFTSLARWELFFHSRAPHDVVLPRSPRRRAEYLYASRRILSKYL